MRIRTLLLALSSLWCFPLMAQQADFKIITSGPHHVVQGHFLYVLLQGQVLSGTADMFGNYVVPTITGAPAGTTIQFANMIRFCCTTSLWSVDAYNPVKISTSSTTPLGTYPLTITYTTAAGLRRSTTYTIFVDPLATLNQRRGRPFPPTPSLTGLKQWTSDRVYFGGIHCTANELTLSQANVWYYDGERVYYQIADATGDTSWNACALLEQSLYRPYVLSGNGWLNGYEVFPRGLAMNYQRTGDPLSRQAVAELGELGAYSSFPNAAWMIDWSVAREVAYGIEAGLEDQALGAAPTPYFQDQVEMLFGDFDQWFVSKTASFVQPFMVALAAEALIVSRDPRVPTTEYPPPCKKAADQLWQQSWNGSCACFLYYNGDGTTSSAGLIVPLYGWMYQQSGDGVYRDMGDQIFNSGVKGAWLYGGKQFSQNYRWSEKYVQWRLATK